MKAKCMSRDECGIYIRPITLDDSDDIVRWRNSEGVKKYFIYQDDFTREEHIKWYNTKIQTGEAIQFIIVEKSTEKSIGSVYLRDIDLIHKKAEYGIFIGEKAAKGKGYGTQAAKLILEYAFQNVKLHRVYLRVYADNERAIASYKNAGFSLEGILKDDVFVRGEYRDIAWMAITNEEE